MIKTMKTIEVDNELYRYIASQTHHIGESASDILRRLLLGPQADLHPVVALGATADRPEGILVSKHSGKNDPADRARQVRSLLLSSEFTMQEKAIGRFMLILSTLHRIDQSGFSQAAALKGRTRLYFAEREETLLESGKTTKPKRIPNTPFWVITNTNTGRKRQMVHQLMIRMGFTREVVDKVIGTI